MPNNLKFGLPLLVVAFVVFSLAFYGGAKLVEEKNPTPAAGEAAAPSGGGAPAAPGGPVNVTVVAKNLQFNPRSISASPGAQITINFDNQDAGVQHNIAFYNNKTAAQKIYVGDLVTGVAQKQEQFTAPTTAGSYFFRCDVHPDQMTGTFVVK